MRRRRQDRRAGNRGRERATRSGAAGLNVLLLPSTAAIATDAREAVSTRTPEVIVNEWLVLRFGALGDLCLLGWSLSALADSPGSETRRVTLVTKAGFAPLAGRFHGVHQVISLEGRGLAPLITLAGQLRARRWQRVVDAHHVLRSHALLTLVGRRADARLAKDTAARLRLLAGGAAGDGLARTMVDRFDAALSPPDAKNGVAAGDPSTPVRPPLWRLAATIDGNPDAPAPLGLAPGARWETKRWPEHHWVALVESLASAGERDLQVFLGPEERAWYRGSRLAAAAEAAGATVVDGRSLVEVAMALAGCRALATNDSGLLHVAEAVGTPVLAFFGPTVRAFGYFPRLPHSRVLEQPLDCRPCSRNGKRPCHRGDLACLQTILPTQAAAALRNFGRRP